MKKLTIILLLSILLFSSCDPVPVNNTVMIIEEKSLLYYKDGKYKYRIHLDGGTGELSEYLRFWSDSSWDVGDTIILTKK